MAEGAILLVEDETAQRQLVARILSRQGYEVREAASGAEALAQLEADDIDLVISDWRLGEGLDGMALLERLKAGDEDGLSIRPSFIMVTAFGTVAHAMEAVRAGADDYLEKPFERGKLLLAVERTLRSRDLARENRRLSEALGERDRLVDLIGRSAVMTQLFRTVQKVAKTHATVLITGESGTGKELAARALHALSRRDQAPFLAVNCAAIPEALLESEFFGVAKGAYSGAHQSRKGRFEAADGGTLFLDEIGELPLELQAKLLRAIQEKSVTPVGRNEPVQTDVRIIAATNRDLTEEVRAGRFREDLYYRLEVVTLTMPPLRERREDISALIAHFVTRAAREHELPAPRFTPALTRRLLDHPWPGNVRQLANVVERVVLLAEGGIARVEELPPGFEPQPAGAAFALPPEGLDWEAHERSCLEQALEMTRSNRAAAARLLGLPYKAFLYRLEKHALKP